MWTGLCDLPLLSRLDISGNNLLQALPKPHTTNCFPELREVDLGGLNLAARLPRWVSRPSERLGTLHLAGNAFGYPQSSTEEADLQQLIGRCNRQALAGCTGLPPTSCSAFGGKFRPSSDGARCIECKDQIWVPVVTLVGVFLSALIMLILFARFVQRHPYARKGSNPSD